MSGKDELNRANPSTLDSAFQAMGIGTVLATGMPRWLRNLNQNTAPANPYIGATLSAIHSAGDAVQPPAATILRATVKAGGVTGELTVEPYGTTPATTQIAVAPNGDIVTLTADAITQVDVTYQPELGEVLDITGVAVPSTGTLPIPGDTAGVMANGRTVVLLMEAELLTGAVPGKKIVLIPATSHPATGNANINLAKTQVLFTAADVGAGGGTARLRLWVSPLKDPGTFMGGADIAP